MFQKVIYKRQYNKPTIEEIEAPERTGGIAGESGPNSKILLSYNDGKINGNIQSGGVVGIMFEEAIIENCYNTGEVLGDNYAGGIIGWIDTITLKNSYNVRNVEKNQFSGGIVGKNRTGTIENTFMLDTTCDKIVGENENPIKQEVEVKNADYFRSNSILEALGNEIWEIVGAKNNGYPVLK